MACTLSATIEATEAVASVKNVNLAKIKEWPKIAQIELLAPIITPNLKQIDVMRVLTQMDR